MKTHFLKGAVFVFFSLMFCSSTFARNKSVTIKALALTGKVPVIIVGQTAKITYKTTKFAVKEVALPVAKATLKPLVLTVAPKATLFLLKETGKTTGKIIPIGSKMAVKYVKSKFAL